jgi:hypothetical protein
VLKVIHRFIRRHTVAGVEFMYDYEAASAHAVYAALDEEARRKLHEQLKRYDRIDRSENKKKQKFIDDDSDFRRSDWPKAILFEDTGLTHAADVELRHVDDTRATVRAQLYFIWGRCDGFEFTRIHTKDVPLIEMPIRETLCNLPQVETKWSSTRVRLYSPLGHETSEAGVFTHGLE